MYEYIKGILTKITAKYIVVETAGIGYLLHVANPYAYSGKMNQEVQVYLHQVVREDAHLLYGFATEEEKQLFLNLISVSGIGPVSALAIIAETGPIPETEDTQYRAFSILEILIFQSRKY